MLIVFDDMIADLTSNKKLNRKESFNKLHLIILKLALKTS